MSDSNSKIRHRIAELIETIREHQYRYYVEDKPTIKDGDFDQLWRELLELEQSHPELIDPNSPTLEVGGGFSTQFDQVDHLERMMSLDNVFDDEELDAWFERVESKASAKFSWLCELKIDGLAINLIYESGRLIRAQIGRAHV